jgi:hypothetical protein
MQMQIGCYAGYDMTSIHLATRSCSNLAAFFLRYSEMSAMTLKYFLFSLAIMALAVIFLGLPSASRSGALPKLGKVMTPAASLAAPPSPST